MRRKYILSRMRGAAQAAVKEVARDHALLPCSFSLFRQVITPGGFTCGEIVLEQEAQPEKGQTNEITPPEVARLDQQASHPFQPVVCHPARAAAQCAGEIIKGSPCTPANTGRESLAIMAQPSFLARCAKADDKNIRLCCANLCQHLFIFLALRAHIKVAVVGSNDLERRVLCLQRVGSALGNARRTS